MSLDRRAVMKSNLLVASIAFSVFASALQAAENPKPWAKKFTMSREECSRRKVKFRQEHGNHPVGFSNLYAIGRHDYDSYKPSWVSKCRDRYGQQ
jgi:hypothetical protein